MTEPIFHPVPGLPAGGVLHMAMQLMPGRVFDPGDTYQLRAAAHDPARYHAIVSRLRQAEEQDRSASLASLGPPGQENLYAAADVVSPLLGVGAGAEVREDARYPAALPEVFQARRLIVAAKMCGNLLIKQALAPRQPRDALGFALLLRRECARVRWLTDNPLTVTEDA